MAQTDDPNVGVPPHDVDVNRLRELATKEQEARLTPQEQNELNRLKAEGSAKDAFEAGDPKEQGTTGPKDQLEHEKNKRKP